MNLQQALAEPSETPSLQNDQCHSRCLGVTEQTGVVIQLGTRKLKKKKVVVVTSSWLVG